jgi:hypothetical protein
VLAKLRGAVQEELGTTRTRYVTMKRLITLATSVIFLATPFVCSAYYVIHLKNGGSFKTDSYWKQDKTTMFYHRGGIVGVEDNDIKEITKIDVQDNENIHANYEQNSVDESEINSKKVDSERNVDNNAIRSEEVKAENSKGSKNTVETQKIDFEDYRNRKIELKRKLDWSIEKFRQASGNKNQEEKKKAMKDMTDISKQIFDLEAELKQKNHGELPDWWANL